MDSLALNTERRALVPLPIEPVRRVPVGAVLRRRAKLFAMIAVALTALVALVVVLLPKSYTTDVKFIVGSDAQSDVPGTGWTSGSTVLPALNAILAGTAAQSADTYAEMVRQTPGLNRVIDQEHLNMTSTQLLKHINVKSVTNTSILDVTVSWPDREESARIANGLAAAFVDVRRSLVSDQAGSAIQSIEQQLPAARAVAARSSGALSTFMSKNGIADTDQQTTALVATLSGLDQKISAVQVDAQQTEAQLAVVRAQLAATNPTMSGGHQVAPNPAAAALELQLAQVEVQLKALTSQYTEQYPAVRALRTQEGQLRLQIAALPKMIVAQDSTIANPVRQAIDQTAATLGAQAASDKAQLATLEQQRRQSQPTLRALPHRTAVVVQLKEQAKQDLDVVAALEQKLSQARLTQSTVVSDISIIAPAVAADAKVSPNVPADIAAGFLLALLVAAGVVFAVERFDTSFKTEQDVTDRLGLPVLSSIPQLPQNAGSTPEWMQAVTIDAFLQLVTSLRYASSERLETIAFTSAGAEDGKSLIALKTAIALADLTPRVLLLDADLRLPSLHQKLNVVAAPGLSDVLVGTSTFEDAVRQTPHKGLDVLVAGTKVPNAFALLQSPAFARLLEDLRGRYESIIIDTPACGAVIDAALVCARADATVYVLAAGQTEAHLAKAGLTRLRQAGVRNIIGSVLNRTIPRRSTIGPYGTASTDGAHILPPPPRPRGQAPV